MTRACRQRCTGGCFDHDETVMSIAVAGRLLRCPICRREVEIGPASDEIRATPGVDAGKNRVLNRRRRD
jgi:hypothetical protein